METADKMNQEHQPRARKQTVRRVKTGCMTCRKRRIKCDELKPACRSCTSSGRACAGYGIWGDGTISNNKGTASPIPSSNGSKFRERVSLMSIPLSPTTSLSQPEYDALDHFQSYMTEKLSGVFESEFWGRLVLQAGAQENFILHSLIALGAGQLHDEQQAVSSYHRALENLIGFNGQRNVYALRVTLITCLLFASFEFLRGSRSIGIVHLQHGIRLLSALPAQAQCTTGYLKGHQGKRSITLPPEDTRSVDDCIIDSFTRLSVQFTLFGHGSEILCPLGFLAGGNESSTYHLPATFHSVNEARRWLDLLMNEIFWLSAQADELTIDGSSVTLPRPMHRRRKRVQIALGQWLTSLETGPPFPQIMSGKCKFMGPGMLRVYHTLSQIMVATCLRGRDEAVFDDQRAQFASLLHKICYMWEQADGCRLAEPKHGFVVDMGSIPPLYFTALKCRDPGLRRIAADLLEKAPDVEGAWDGTFAASIARAVIAQEEITCDEINSRSAQPTSAPLKRASKVVVHPDETVRGRARVKIHFHDRRQVGGKLTWASEVKELIVDAS